MEYDKDNLNINADLFWNHGCDSFIGLAPGWTTSNGPWWSTTNGVIYTFDGSQTTDLFDKNLTNVVGCQLPYFIRGDDPWALVFYFKVSVEYSHEQYILCDNAEPASGDYFYVYLDI